MRTLFASWLRSFLADVRNRAIDGRDVQDEMDFISKIDVESFLGQSSGEIISLRESFDIFTKTLPGEIRKVYVALDQIRDVFLAIRIADTWAVYLLDGRIMYWKQDEGDWHVRDRSG